MGLYDCDIPVDGSTAIIVSAADHAASLPRPPVYVEAVGSAIRTRFSWDQQEDLAAMAATSAAEHLWSRTGLTPADVDLDQAYSGVRAVFSTLRDAVSRGEFNDVLAQLPNEFQLLLEPAAGPW